MSKNKKENHVRSLVPGDKSEVRKLFDEWFPIKYDDDFIIKVCNGDYPIQTYAIVNSEDVILGIIVLRFEPYSMIEVF